MITKNYKDITCTNIELNILGVSTHYKKQIWVDDPNEIGGGSFQYVNMKHAEPKIDMRFSANVNVELKIGEMYSDGQNIFQAISSSQIMLQTNDVVAFTIPTKLAFFRQPIT